MSSPENDDLHLDLTFTAHDNQKLIRGVAAGVAAVLIIGVLATMTTDVAARMLPMNDEYLQALLPRAADGKQALALKELNHTILENTLNVSGSVLNRTDFPVSGILAVITATDVKYGKKVVEVPIDPVEIPSQQLGKFQADVVLEAQPSIYSLEFRVPDGPIVPHLDDRALTPITPEMSPPVVTPPK